jgi:hypothetical protein
MSRQLSNERKRKSIHPLMRTSVVGGACEEQAEETMLEYTATATFVTFIDLFIGIRIVWENGE